MVTQTCAVCGTEFNVCPAKIKVGKGKYCSNKCYTLARFGHERPVQSCRICGKEFSVSSDKIKKGYGNFCSTKCYMESNNYKNRKTRLKIYKFACLQCGKEFERNGHDKHNHKFCSLDCSKAYHLGEKHQRYNSLKVVCEQCGQVCSIPEFRTKRDLKWGNFCSAKCKGEWQSEHIIGDKNHNWLGGISFEPYCPKFNNAFKERVRAFFKYACVICGQPQGKKKLHVHHIHYHKDSCCNGDSPHMFAALCISCHTKTNHNRDYWTGRLVEIIMKDYNGRSYLTEEEYQTYTTSLVLTQV